jgi:uncharacterized membrane protein YkvA (DUF1232 family)
MAAWNTSSLQRPGFLLTLLSRARLATRLLREPRVPRVAKAVPVLAALYLIFPLDAVPDIIPVLGQLDDLGVVLLALELFLRLCPMAAVAFHRAAVAAGQRYGPMPAAADVIDAEWRRE